MVARLGNVLYWAATALALLGALAVFFFLNYGDGPDKMFFVIMSAAFSILIWLLGRAILYVLAGR